MVLFASYNQTCVLISNMFWSKQQVNMCISPDHKFHGGQIKPTPMIRAGMTPLSRLMEEGGVYVDIIKCLGWHFYG